MYDPPAPYRRSPARTVMQVMFSMGIPTLGMILGGIEIHTGKYRFGTLLISLAVVSSFAQLLLLRWDRNSFPAAVLAGKW